MKRFKIFKISFENRLHKIRHKSEADLLSVKNVTTTQEGKNKKIK